LLELQEILLELTEVRVPPCLLAILEVVGRRRVLSGIGGELYLRRCTSGPADLGQEMLVVRKPWLPTYSARGIRPTAIENLVGILETPHVRRPVLTARVL